MPSVAEQLRFAREQQKLSIQQVADALKVRTDQVKALENGQFEVFPAPVYVKGFIRGYAKLLKVNYPSMLAGLDEELSVVPKFRDSQSARANSQAAGSGVFFALSRLNWVLVLTVLGIITLSIMAILGYQSWQKHKRQDQNLDLGSGLYAPQKRTPGETLPLPNK